MVGWNKTNKTFKSFASRLYQIGQGRSIRNGKSVTLCGSDDESGAVRGSSRLTSLEALVFVEKENERPVTNV